MLPEKGRTHQLQEQPVEGDRDVIDRELARNTPEQQQEKTTRNQRRGKSKINPDATPGTGMLPGSDPDDPNMAPTG
jgi:hypothetical protein